MSKFTMTFGEVFCAQLRSSVKSTNAETIELPTYRAGEWTTVTWTIPNLNNILDKTPVYLTRHHAADVMQSELGPLACNFKDGDDVFNQAVIETECQAFARRFWLTEIGQEDPLAFWNVLAGFFDAWQPLFVQEYRQLMLDPEQTFLTHNSWDSGNTTNNFNGDVSTTGGFASDTWTTSESATMTSEDVTTSQASQASTASHQTGTGNTMTGVADTPQNQLDFQLDSPDPSQDYQFSYASQVTGTKNQTQTDTSTTASDAMQENVGTQILTHGVGSEHVSTRAHSETYDKTFNADAGTSTMHRVGRDEDIPTLIAKYNRFADGLYNDLWQKTYGYGMWLQIIR